MSKIDLIKQNYFDHRGYTVIHAENGYWNIHPNKWDGKAWIIESASNISTPTGREAKRVIDGHLDIALNPKLTKTRTTKRRHEP